MSGEFVLFIGRRTLEMALLLSAPVLAVTLVSGLLVSILQAVTSIRDSTIGLVIKLICVGLALLVCGGWMMQLAVNMTTEIFNHMQSMSR